MTCAFRVVVVSDSPSPSPRRPAQISSAKHEVADAVEDLITAGRAIGGRAGRVSVAR
jgi:hypothetical protein